MILKIQTVIIDTFLLLASKMLTVNFALHHFPGFNMNINLTKRITCLFLTVRIGVYAFSDGDVLVDTCHLLIFTCIPTVDRAGSDLWVKLGDHSGS